MAIPSLCLNSLSFTSDETIETTAGQYAMPKRKNSRPIEMASSVSCLYALVVIGT